MTQVTRLGDAPPFDARQFRNAMGQFASGVVVISTENDGEPHAMTANAFMSGSLEPPLVLVSVAVTARMHDRLRAAGRFGVSVLALTQQAISNHFAGKPMLQAPGFERLADMPVVTGAAVQLSAQLHHDYPCGDHTLFVGRVLALRTAAEAPKPLLFHAGRYGRVAEQYDLMPTGFYQEHECQW